MLLTSNNKEFDGGRKMNKKTFAIITLLVLGFTMQAATAYHNGYFKSPQPPVQDPNVREGGHFLSTSFYFTGIRDGITTSVPQTHQFRERIASYYYPRQNMYTNRYRYREGGPFPNRIQVRGYSPGSYVFDGRFGGTREQRPGLPPIY